MILSAGVFADDHFAVATVEFYGKALSIVQKEQGSACFCSLMDRAHAKFMADAVFGAHEFCSWSMFQFVGLFNGFCSCVAIYLF